MHIFISLTQAIASMIIIYLLAVKMLKSGILKEEHSLIFARIVTDLCLSGSNLLQSRNIADKTGSAQTIPADAGR